MGRIFLAFAVILGLAGFFAASNAAFAHEGRMLEGSSMQEMREFMQGEMGENASTPCEDFMPTTLIEAGEVMMGGVMTEEQHLALEEKMEELSPDLHDRMHGMMGMWATGCVGDEVMASMASRYGYISQRQLSQANTLAVGAFIAGGLLGAGLVWILSGKKR